MYRLFGFWLNWGIPDYGAIGSGVWTGKLSYIHRHSSGLTVKCAITSRAKLSGKYFLSCISPCRLSLVALPTWSMAGGGKVSYGWYNPKSCKVISPFLVLQKKQNHIWFLLTYFPDFKLRECGNSLPNFSQFLTLIVFLFRSQSLFRQLLACTKILQKQIMQYLRVKNPSCIVYYTQHIAKISRLLQWSIVSSSCSCIGKSELLLHFVVGWPSILLSWCLLIDLLCWGGRAEKDLDVNIFTLESFWTW